MINRKFSGPLGRATKFSHPRATMSVIVVIFTAANKFTAFCAIRLLDFRPTDHRRPTTKHRKRADARCFDHEGCRRHARGRWGSRCARQRLVSLTSKQDFASSGANASDLQMAASGMPERCMDSRYKVPLVDSKTPT